LPVTAPSIFCRHCGYPLADAGSGSPCACPECGRAYDPADPRTVVRDRPPRLALRRWVKRLAVACVLLAILAGAGVTWLWYGWHQEQNPIALIRLGGGRVTTERVELGPLDSVLAVARLGYLRDRAVSVVVGGAGDIVFGTDLRPLRQLRELDLGDSDADDAPSLSNIARLPAMTRLTIRWHGVKGADVADLSGLSALEYLDLSHTSVDDAGLAHLAGLRRLKTLRLLSTPVTGEGFDALRDLPNLETINLCDAAVTDAGLRRLANLPALRTLLISGTPTTPPGVAALNAANPAIAVRRSYK
jgi:hypothetical protein